MLRWVAHLKGAPRQYDSPAAVVAGHRLFCFGGPSYMSIGDYQVAVRVFNTVSLRWRKLPPVTDETGERPPEVPHWLEYHTAVMIEDVVYIWGGLPYPNLLFAFEVDPGCAWVKASVSGTVPEGRQGHSACAVGRAMYIHGGYKHHTGYTNDTDKLDTATMVWSKINARGAPAPSTDCHSATVIGTSIFVFGGRGNWANGGWDTDLRVLDTETDWWLRAPAALPPRSRQGRRMGHAAFAHDGELYVLGGRSWNRTYNDMWKFNPQTFSWRRVEPQGRGGPGRMSRMCCCVVGERVFFFGGYRPNRQAPNDLYVLDLSPSLMTLCKRAVIRHGLEQSELPYDIRWELEAMTTRKKLPRARRKRTRRRGRQLI